MKEASVVSKISSHLSEDPLNVGARSGKEFLNIATLIWQRFHIELSNQKLWKPTSRSLTIMTNALNWGTVENENKQVG